MSLENFVRQRSLIRDYLREVHGVSYNPEKTMVKLRLLDGYILEIFVYKEDVKPIANSSKTIKVHWLDILDYLYNKININIILEKLDEEKQDVDSP